MPAGTPPEPARKGTRRPADRPRRVHRKVRHRSRRASCWAAALRRRPRLARPGPVATARWPSAARATSTIFTPTWPTCSCSWTRSWRRPRHGRSWRSAIPWAATSCCAYLAENGLGSAGGRRASCSPMTGAAARGDAALGADADARDRRRSRIATCSAPARSCCWPASSTPISSPTTSAATASPTSGSQADPRLPWAARPSAGRRQAVRSMTAAVAPGYLERIDLPLLLISAGQDPLSNPATHASVAARLRHGRALHHRRRQARSHDGDRRPARPLLGGLRPAGERRARAMTLTQVLVTALAFLVAGVAKGAIGMGLPPIAHRPHELRACRSRAPSP